jgi:hypothetical protein
MGKTIPTRDADFNVRQQTISEAAETNMVDWQLDVDWMGAEFTPKKNAWLNAWENYLNPDTRTPVFTLAKQVARKGYEPPLRRLVQMLESNPRVSVTDLKAMGIEIPDHTNTPAPVDTTFPASQSDVSMIRFVKVFFHDFDSTNKAKPKGQHGAEMRWMILEAPPVGVKELINSVFDTNSPFTLEFEDAERGKTLYYCLRWENTRGQKGPWSEIESAIVP